MILVGGACENTTGYIADDSIDYGNSFASTNNSKNNKTESTPYSTVYTKVISNDGTDNYNANINKVFGDGIIETSTAGINMNSWHSAWSGFVCKYNDSNNPFFIRGGTHNISTEGSFNFDSYNGDNKDSIGFRVCLAVR